MWRKRKREQEPVSDEAGLDTGIGEECEAYLAGTLAAYLHERGRPIPPVGWLNQLVHATPNRLAFLAVDGNADAAQPSTWRRTVGYLSRSVLQRSRETGRPIAELQRDLLVPLELELLGDPDAVHLDSSDVIRITLTRLYELPELPA